MGSQTERESKHLHSVGLPGTNTMTTHQDPTCSQHSQTSGESDHFDLRERQCVRHLAQGKTHVVAIKQMKGTVLWTHRGPTEKVFPKKALLGASTLLPNTATNQLCCLFCVLLGCHPDCHIACSQNPQAINHLQSGLLFACPHLLPLGDTGQDLERQPARNKSFPFELLERSKI